MVCFLFYSNCRIPHLDDIIDDKFVSDERLQNESSIYQILTNKFHDPFYEIKPPDYNTSGENNTGKIVQKNKKPSEPKKIRIRTKRKKKNKS
jgi:hypothetical protein